VKNLRIYGTSPYGAAVVHGGPGAAGEMAPVARRLARRRGVLEPLQTADTLDGQVEELKNLLQTHAGLPVTLIGFSWGAWLGFITAAAYPALVGKLILIGSGGFEEKYADNTQETRLSRLDDSERVEVARLVKGLENPAVKDKDKLFARLGALFSAVDAYDLLTDQPVEDIQCRVDIFLGVWNEADALRRSGKLLEMGKLIRCPVTAIHGDYDPHPAEGVKQTLGAVLNNFRFVLLKNCGHRPWLERQAKEKFYRVLNGELS
jgi:pimeloyl-ACP methyl ester carboxylesterase